MDPWSGINYYYAERYFFQHIVLLFRVRIIISCEYYKVGDNNIVMAFGLLAQSVGTRPALWPSFPWYD